MNYLLFFISFSVLDRVCSSFDRPYLLVKSIYDSGLAYLTYSRAVLDITDFGFLHTHPVATDAMDWMIGFYMYCVFVHRREMYGNEIDRAFDIAMMFLVNYFAPSPCLFGYTLFFLSLPCGIDSFLLFIVRNRWISRKIGTELDEWVHYWWTTPLMWMHYYITLFHIKNHVRFNISLWIGALMAIYIVHTNRYQHMIQKRGIY